MRMGVKRALRRAAGQAVSALYWKVDEIVLVKALGEAAAPVSGPQLRVEAAEYRHVALLAGFNRRNCDAARTRRFTARLQAGAGAFLAFLDDQLIGYLWWADARSVADAEPRFARYQCLRSDEVYGFDLFLAPEYRGQGTSTQFLARVESELHRLGYSHMWSYVDSENRPARFLFSISGHQPAGRVQSTLLFSRFLRVSVERRPARRP
jgi:GNAT superfamily N-acetyltransferase